MPSKPDQSDLRSASATIARTLKGVRRAVLLRRRWLAAVCAAVAVAAGVQAAAAPAPATATLVTAARDLAGGTVLGAQDLVEIQVDPETLPLGVILNPIGRVLASPLRRGEAITDVRLVGSGLLQGHPGLTAVPVRIPDPAVVELLRVGDTFDLLATDPEGSGTRVVADDVVVLAKPTPSAESASIGISGALIVIGTSAEEATEVANSAVQAFLSVQFSP